MKQSGQPEREGQAWVEPPSFYGVNCLSGDPNIGPKCLLRPTKLVPEGLNIIPHTEAFEAPFVITV